ncbi:uncharacterized protein G9a [Ochlerotatus camptorhynchus]|uniref:uncharacterized protein G9a n=1 Tax=Ochlerotatus camptorhynchus TaxID=644619 RepID=UPI0031DB5BE8
MDFIDNLLNHMSSKFNQESTLPKQAEISMDETFKWRALKNNQFASRSKNGRSKIKSKDKDKKDAASSELNMSSDENNKSDSSQDPIIADVSESADIEIEIANDISGAEIQEVLASTQGNVPVLLEETSALKAVSLNEINETINIANDSELIEGSTCTSNSEHINDEVFEKVVHSENDVRPIQDDLSVEKKYAENTEIVDGKPELAPTITKHNDPDAKHIFIHMSSTFNGSCLIKSSSNDNLLQMQNSPSANEETSSSNLKATVKNDNASENHKDHPSPTSVRRSKRLKHDQTKDSELTDVEHLSNQQTSTFELPSISSKSSNDMSDEQININDTVKIPGDKTDNTVRTLRNKSFGIKLNEPEAKTKTTAKKKYKNDPKVQESPRKVVHVKELHSVSPETRKVTRSKTVLRKIPTTRRTQHIRSNYPTRQRNRIMDKNAERRKRSSRFWKNAKNQTSKLGKESEQKPKHSQETQKETAKTKNPKERSPKRSVRLSKDGSDGILASAIARREKNDITGIQGRLSRPIKLSAKILANDELRYGFELQNNARLNLNVEVKDSSNTKELLKFDVDSTSGKTEISEAKIPIPISQPDNTLEQRDSFPSEPLSNVQIKCPDPLEFLNEVKRNNLGSNKSPECNSKLTKIQQKRLLKLKEKHLFMLGLQKTNNNKSLADTNNQCIETISINKEDTKALTHSSNTIINTCTNANDAQINDDMKTQTEASTHALPATHLQSKMLCFCQKDTRYFTTKTQSRMYCTATDDIDGQMIGCCNELKGGLQNLLRPSNSASYQLLCLTHQRRLHHHGCCATCGVYCTQGYFIICSNKHLFHRECAEKFIINTKGKSSPIIPKLVLKCPHCGLESVIREYKIRLQKSLSFAIVTTRH